MIRVRGIERPCDQCHGRGVEVVDAYTERRVETIEQRGERYQRMVRCATCGGTGRWKWWRNGDELTDTCRECWGAKVVPAPDYPVRPWRMPLSANADTLAEGSPIVVALEAGIPGSGKAYERRLNEGDYEQLGLSLAALKLDHPHLYRLNVRVYVEALCEEDDLGGSELFLLEMSLRYLARLMPDEIRVPSWAPQFEKRRREKAEGGREEAVA
jgi:hypothetical protein